MLCFATRAAEKDAAEKAEAEHKERLQADKPADPPAAAPPATDATDEPSSVAEHDAAPDGGTAGEGTAGEDNSWSLVTPSCSLEDVRLLFKPSHLSFHNGRSQIARDGGRGGVWSDVPTPSAAAAAICTLSLMH